MEFNRIIQGDALEVLRGMPGGIVQSCVTSPPYFGLRDYGIDGQIGLEETPEAYIQRLVEVFREVKRVLRPDGLCFINLGDSYSGSGKGYGSSDHGKLGKHANDFLPPPTDIRDLPAKNLLMIPARVALALQSDGWIVRSTIIWHKPNCMPESVQDRPTTAHEYIYMLAKSERYYYDADAIREPVGVFKFSGNGKYNGSDTKARDMYKQTEYNPAGRNKRSVWTIATMPYA